MSGVADGPDVVLSAVRKGKQTEWPAKIVRTEGVVDEKSRVTYAVARIADPYALHSENEPLPMGTFVSARIDGSAVSDVYRVPNSAVRGANELLFVDADSAIRIRAVNVVRTDSEFTYFRGVTEGESIVTSALESPIEGMAIRTEATPSGDASSKVATTDLGDEG